ncbi:MAG: major facilitator superfamily 1 [Nocardioides sp.]|nr:major facilitator superfamily 1 [Nocardioides sp.]
MKPELPCQGSRFEELFSGGGAALFSFAMGLSAVAAPLLALSAGYDAGQVGVYVAGSAFAQLATRSFMGSLMRRIADKYFVTLAGVAMAFSCAVFVESTAWWAFLLSQVFQGIARGLFWTGTQTHAVRTSRSSVGAIAKVNLASGIGLITGPVIAGPIVDHWSAATALTVATVAGLAVVLPAALMVRLPPMRPTRPDGASRAVWRRPGVGMASWAGASAGAWRSLMNSYVPIILDQARQSSSVIGVVVGVANATSIAGGAGAGWIREARLRSWLVGGILVTGLGLTLFGLLAGQALVAGAALALSGAGAGLLQTVGPALATEAVSPDERGEAIASAGTFRAAALLAAPLSVAALITVTTVPVAVAIAGAAMALPPLLNRRRSA